MNQIKRLVKYIIDSKNEIKKVTWPNKKEVRQHTYLVIGISLGVAAFLGILDFIFDKIMKQII